MAPVTMSGVCFARCGCRGGLIFLVLFEPTVAYRARRPAARIDSCEFVNYVSAIVNARPLPPAEVRVLNDGEQVFAAELRAIREARRSIHLEVYLFLRGRVAEEMLAALEERARSGVRVRLIVDRYGTSSRRSATSAR
jgi:cardiolipin synthase